MIWLETDWDQVLFTDVFVSCDDPSNDIGNVTLHHIIWWMIRYGVSGISLTASTNLMVIHNETVTAERYHSLGATFNIISTLYRRKFTTNPR